MGLPKFSRKKLSPVPLIILLIFALTTSVCRASVPNPETTLVAKEAGKKQHPFISSTLNLADYGYVENEFLISGFANIYSKKGKWNTDGKWNTKIAKSAVPYTTRMLVRRPQSAADFNGMVVIEWLNNTAFMDVDVIWAQSHKELIRSGYAWIGLSTQTLGVNALKAWDEERYETLRLTTDALSYDIFSQAAKAVRIQSDYLLGGLGLVVCSYCWF